MNAEAINALGKTIVDSALDMAARKAGVPVSAIVEACATDPHGNCARYVADLIVCGIRNADNIVNAVREGRCEITAAELA